MRVCVCTVVHHPEDARILHRQIRALLDAGHEVTYIAPFRAFNVTPWRNLSPVDVPLPGRRWYAGRRWLQALRTARRALAEHAAYADLVLVHDPELMMALPREVRRRTVVWDVREDVSERLPRPLLRRIEDRGERRHRLLLAQEDQRSRFRDRHPVVPDLTYVPELAPAKPDGKRVVYVGRLSISRGILEMIDLAGRLRDGKIAVELIGAADPEVRPRLREAQRAGVLRWYGFVPNDRALRIAEGAMAGLALMRERPGQSVPVKVAEYMARGIPVITTPNEAAAELVRSSGGGLVVPFNDIEATAAAIERLQSDAPLRVEMGERGYQTARARFQWPGHAERFVAQLESWAAQTSPLLNPAV